MEIQFVTVSGCAAAKCPDCDLSERILRRAIELAGSSLPSHREGNRGEFFLADGRTIELVHLSCIEAGAKNLEPANAPYLIVDGNAVVSGAEADPQRLSKAILDALFPGGAVAHFGTGKPQRRRETHYDYRAVQW